MGENGQKMSEENILEEAVELVKEAQSQKVFNLADAIKGRAYPTTSVRVFLDDESALKLSDINQKLNKAPSEEEIKKLTKEAEGLSKKIIQSALVFEMRGVGQAAIDAISQKLNTKHKIGPTEVGSNNSEWLRDYVTTLVAMNIVSVTNADGAIDSSEFDFDKGDQLRQTLAPSEWSKLVAGMQKLTLAGGYFDQLTDAGFLPKS